MLRRIAAKLDPITDQAYEQIHNEEDFYAWKITTFFVILNKPDIEPYKLLPDNLDETIEELRASYPESDEDFKKMMSENSKLLKSVNPMV